MHMIPPLPLLCCLVGTSKRDGAQIRVRLAEVLDNAIQNDNQPLSPVRLAGSPELVAGLLLVNLPGDTGEYGITQAAVAINLTLPHTHYCEGSNEPK